MFDAAVVDRLEQAAGRTGKRDAAFGRLTTIGCGGTAAFLIEADSSEHLAALLEVAAPRSIDCFILGLGSNLLVADTGWDGLVIRMTGQLKECLVNAVGGIDCGGGASLPRVAALAAEAGLSGLEPLSGIPGTMGGAVAMNAGAWGTAIGDLIEQVEVCLPGDCRRLDAEALEFSYRGSVLPAGSAVSRVTLTLTTGAPEVIRASMAEYRDRRQGSQPIGKRTCGSVFKNPAGGRGAGELLEGAGCKGILVGQASVSTTHANFIINRGGATTADVVVLMDECRRRVWEKFSITLEPEVRFLGGIGLKPL